VAYTTQADTVVSDIPAVITAVLPHSTLPCHSLVQTTLIETERFITNKRRTHETKPDDFMLRRTHVTDWYSFAL